MEVFRFSYRYLLWHYTRGLAERARDARHLVFGTLHFFSVPLLLATFTDPFIRVHDKSLAGSGVVHESSNLILSLIGVCVRTVTILCGLVAALAAFFSGVVLIFIWLILVPFLFVALLFSTLLFIHAAG